METLISNINGVQRKTRGKRQFLVAPTSLIVPGVLNGSKGSLYYPSDEVERVVDPWNGMPVVVYHPSIKGQPVSGRHPDVYDIGRVYNAKYNGKLTAEAWIDEELLMGIDQGADIRDRLLRGEKMEVSTGLYTENEKKSGVDTASGKPYEYIARRYRPDHLAILPDQKGACSVNDGCGLNVNSNPQGYNQYTGKGAGAHPAVKRPAADVEKVSDLLTRGLVKKGMPASNSWVEMKDDHFHIMRTGGMSSASYAPPIVVHTLGHKDAHVDDLKTEAKKWAKQNLTTNSSQGSAMNKDQLINWLVANSGVWTEEDRPTLNATPEPKLKAMKDKMEPKKEGCTCEGKDKPTENKVMTSQEWLAAAPPEWTSVLNNAKDIELQERQRLANIIVANTENKEAREAAYKVYMGMPLATLKTLAAATPSAPVVNAQQQANDLAGLLPYGQQTQQQALYFGAAGGPPVPTNNAVDKTDIIPVQEIDWAELSKETLKHGTVAIA